MPQLMQLLPQLARYKKSLILISAGLGVGIAFTLLVQCLSGGSKQESQQAEQAPAPSSSGMRIAGSTNVPAAATNTPHSAAAAPSNPFAPASTVNNPFLPVPPAPQQQISGYAPTPFPSDGRDSYGRPSQQTYAQAPGGVPQGYNTGPAPVGTMDYGQSGNGYPVAVGRRAVDSYVPGGGVLPAVEAGGSNNVIIDGTQSSNTVIDPTPGLDVSQMTVGRNGLLGNPCSDPASCRGRAYSTGAQ